MKMADAMISNMPTHAQLSHFDWKIQSRTSLVCVPVKLSYSYAPKYLAVK